MQTRPPMWGTADKFLGEVKDGVLTLPTRTFSEAEDKNGNVTIRRAGKGAKAVGIAPNTWLIKVGDEVYLRPSGRSILGSHVERGQCTQRDGKLSTMVTLLTGAQRDAVLAAMT